MLDTLKKLVDQNQGALGAIMMGYDGITIEKFIAPGVAVDIETVVTEFSIKLRELRQAAVSLDLGVLKDITIKSDTNTLLFRELNDEIFVALVMKTAGNFGQSRWRLRQGAHALIAEI